MTDALAQHPLWPFVRKVLYSTVVLNLFGALLFTPPARPLRSLLGLPAEQTLYMSIVASWIFIFGLAYWRMARLNAPDRTFILVGAAGKSLFAFWLVVYFLMGELTLFTVTLGFADIAIAIVFIHWLRKTAQ